MIAEYDDSTFTVVQALFPTPASAVDIVESPAREATDAGGTSADEDSDRDLSKGKLAGIIVVCIAVALLIAAAFWFLRKRKLRSNAGEPPSDDDTVVHETAAKAGVNSEPYSELGPGSPLINEKMLEEGIDQSFQKDKDRTGQPILQTARCGPEKIPRTQATPPSLLVTQWKGASTRWVHEFWTMLKGAEHISYQKAVHTMCTPFRAASNIPAY